MNCSQRPNTENTEPMGYIEDPCDCRIKTQLPAAHWATKICLKKSPQAVIVPERLSGMLGGRPEIAEYFLNAYHDMYLGVMVLPRGLREMVVGSFFLQTGSLMAFQVSLDIMTSKQFLTMYLDPPKIDLNHILRSYLDV